jgi:hypothetical protein
LINSSAAVIECLYQILLMVVVMSKTYGLAFTAANLVISILVFVALAAALPSEFFAQAATSKNSTISSAGGNSTMTNATNAAQKNNNVTTAAGNNGHIYRGGAATGSGGE